MRRLAFAVMALLLFSCAARGEVSAVNYKGGALAVDETGAEVIPGGIYESIFVLYDEAGAISGYAAGIELAGIRKYAILSPTGIRLTPFRYTTVAQAGSDFICAIGVEYHIVLAIGTESADVYSALAYAGGGTYLALTERADDDIADALRILDPVSGSRMAGISVMYGLGAFSEGLMPLCEGGSLRFGYVGADGGWAIAPSFEYAGAFSGGFAEVARLDGHGLIDQTGAEVVEVAQDSFARSEDLAIGVTGDRLTAYSIEDGGVRVAFEKDLSGASPSLSGSSVILYGKDAVRVLGADGSERFSLSADTSVAAAGALYVVREGDWDARSAYLADADGRAITAKYNTIRYLDGDLYAYGVMDDTRAMAFGLMRGDGVILTGTDYEEIVRAASGLYFAMSAGGGEMLDARGAVIALLSE